MVSDADQKVGSTFPGAANCETATTFVGSWRPKGVVSYADQAKWGLAVPGGCELRNCRLLRELL